jgi:hypothetical protein
LKRKASAVDLKKAKAPLKMVGDESTEQINNERSSMLEFERLERECMN